MKNGAASTAVQVAALLSLALLGSATRGTAEESRPDADAPTSQRGQRGTAAEAPESDKDDPTEFDWLPFPDGAKFGLLGLHWFGENNPKLWRMPQGRFDVLPDGVKRRCREPAGGRILIKCNATKLALKVTPANKGSLKGFDVYINGKFLRSAVAEEPGVKTDVVLFKALDRREKEIVIYLPYHQEVMIESLGVDKDTKFSPPEHRFIKPLPLVFYGSSVCQGNGALKPGMTYPAKLCRDLNLDFVSLGFGGAGKAEKAVVDLVNSIPACGYVFDLGKSYGMQDGAAYLRMLQTVRQSHPGVPIFCLTPITSTLEVHSQGYSERSVHTRRVMRDAANEFIRSGARDVYLIEGADLLGFDEQDGLSKDGVHPTDYGYSMIAGKLLPVVRKALGL